MNANMLKRIATIASGVVAIVATLFSVGCASDDYRERSVGLSAIPIQSESPESISVRSARLSPAPEGYFVSGMFGMKHGYSPDFGHVHIHLYSDGELIEHVKTGGNPRRVPRTRFGRRGRSSYVARLDSALGSSNEIRVVAHTGTKDTCDELNSS